MASTISSPTSLSDTEYYYANTSEIRPESITLRGSYQFVAKRVLPFLDSIARDRHIRQSAFMLRGKSYEYHLDRFSFCTERTVEMPLARAFFEENNGSEILELGNVSHHIIQDRQHDVVDKYETASGIINRDIVDYNPGRLYDALLSISTLEHIGFDERVKDAKKPEIALQRLLSLLRRDGRVLITVPLGYNPSIDRMIRTGSFGMETSFIKRVSIWGFWEETDMDDALTHRYDHRYPYANAIAVVTR